MRTRTNNVTSFKTVFFLVYYIVNITENGNWYLLKMNTTNGNSNS